MKLILKKISICYFKTDERFLLLFPVKVTVVENPDTPQLASVRVPRSLQQQQGK